jgi:uncharacterized membrane protein YhiD involved in acid resistance
MISKPAFDAMLSLTMLVVVALVTGGIILWRRGNDRKRATLMLVAALVLFGNVLIWSWPR